MFAPNGVSTVFDCWVCMNIKFMSTIVARRPPQVVSACNTFESTEGHVGYVSPFCSVKINATLLESPWGAGEGGW